MKKKKLLTVKEARAKVEAQAVTLEAQRLKINRLENEVQSLEGARQNLVMMYESNVGEMQKAKQATIDALANVKAVARERNQMESLAGAFEAQVRAYEAEKALHMMFRGFKLLLRPVTKPIASFFERVKYRLTGGRG